MAKERRTPLLLGITSRMLLLISAALLLLSYVSVFVNPAKAWFMTLFGLLFVPLALLNIFLLVWAMFRRSAAAWIPLLVLLPALLLVGRFFQFSSGGVEPGPEDVRLVSYNVGRFALSDEKDRMACTDSVVRFLKKQNADIICLQEFYIRDASEIRAFFGRHFRGYDLEYYVYPTEKGSYGNVTLSRFPARSKGKLDFTESSNLALYGDYDIHGTRVRIYNCHFQSYNISPQRIARAVRGDEDYKEIVRETGQRMKSSIILRPRQVDMVLKDIDDCPTASLVVGDFNDNPLSYTYWRLRRGRKDSFMEAGDGFGATYASFRPFLRIDYLLYPGECFRAVSHMVPHLPWSDHYPIVTTLSVNYEENAR